MQSYRTTTICFWLLILALLVLGSFAKAEPIVLLSNGCGSANLAVGNIPSLTTDVQGHLCVSTGGTVITGNAAGSTGAVVGTLVAASGRVTFICGFNVQAIGGTAPVGPITVNGITGSSMVYQGSSSAAGGTVASATFQPCIPASAPNTAITISTTADGTATAVNVNSFGYQQ